MNCGNCFSHLKKSLYKSIAVFMSRLYLILPALIMVVMFTTCGKESSQVFTGQWITLFNGKDLSGWEKQWKGIWKVENGEIVGTGDPSDPGMGFLCTTEEYGDFILKLKFKVAAKANSGIAIRYPKNAKERASVDGYEIQIYNDDAAENPTGSIYHRARAFSGAARNDEWNQCEITCYGDYIKIAVNGQTVTQLHDRHSLNGRIGIQVHDKETAVRVKDVELLPLQGMAVFGPTLKKWFDALPGEFRSLFNGKDLTGWSKIWKDGAWKVEDGMIVAGKPGDKGMGSWLLTDEEFSDFILRLKFKTSSGHNSGVALRYPKEWKKITTPDLLQPARDAYEIQIYDVKGDPGVVKATGSIVEYARSYSNLMKFDEWNQYDIYAQGAHIAVYLNGEKVSEAHVDRTLRGCVGMQMYPPDSSVVYFKDIEIKEIPTYINIY